MPTSYATYDKEATGHPVAVAVRNFAAQSTSLLDVFDPLVNPLHGQYNKAKEDFERVIQHKNQLLNESEYQSPHTMPLEKQTAYIINKQQLDDAQFAFENIPRALLLSLVSIYDHFLRNHIKAIYNIKPELRNTIKTSYAISELIEHTSLAATIEDGIERHLDNILRENHLTQLKSLETLLDMKLTDNVSALSQFIELTERRNIIAHCGGIATPFYVMQCGKHKAQAGASIGQSLGVDKPYFTNCYNCIFEISIKLSQCTWRKIRQDQIHLADHVLRGITYNLLVVERFELSRILLEFAAHELKKHSSDHFARIFTVNLAQCYKWLGDTQKCYEVLQKKDWTATEPAFTLAERVLHDDFDEAGKLMVITGKNKFIPEEAFRDWPLFRQFRDTEQFRKSFIKIYGQPFESELSIRDRQTDAR